MSKEMRIRKLKSTISEYNDMLRLMSGRGAFGVMLVRAFRNNAERKLKNLCGNGIRV